MQVVRVLLSAYACRPDQGSESALGWNWALSLAEQGHEVSVITTNRNQPAIEQAAASLPSDRVLPHFYFVDVPPVPKPFNRFRGYLTEYILWQKRILPKARELDRQFAYEIVHHVTWGTIRSSSQLHRLGKPFILGPVGGGQKAPRAFRSYFGDDWRNEAARNFLIESVFANPLNQASRRRMQRTSLVLATNRDTASLAQQLGGAKVEYFLDCGLHEEFLIDTPRQGRGVADPLRLIWVGRLVPNKGLLLTLESLAAVDPAYDIRLDVYGSGPLESEAHGWIRRLGLESKVALHGRVDWGELRRAYEESDALIFTSLRDSFGAQLLEAMASGLPVITLNHQGARDFLPKEAALMVEVTSPQEVVRALAREIERLAGHPKLHSSMSRTAWEFAKNQTWQHRASKMTGLYEDAVANSSTSR